VASGDIRPYVGHKDIGVMFSVGDLVGGPNAVTRSVLANAVSGLLGMVEGGERISLRQGERTIAVTALGNTEPAVSRATRLLGERGFEVVAFHASGAGGSAMEELMEAGVISGVLDLTPHELTEEVVGAGVYIPVRPGRLSAAGRLGIPQVVSTGAMEYLCFGPRESIPLRLRRRKTYMHNPYNANVKVSRREMAEVGKVMAERLNRAKGPTAVLVPLKGWSIYGGEGRPLHDHQGNRILVEALKGYLKADIHYEEIDAHINDHHFADVCVNVLLGFMEE
ncbi:MAG: Tm-1-like ATP-binding domain-containing protein, partial [Thermodesulfobacteriota bacterium]